MRDDIEDCWQDARRCVGIAQPPLLRVDLETPASAFSVHPGKEEGELVLVDADSSSWAARTFRDDETAMVDPARGTLVAGRAEHGERVSVQIEDTNCSATVANGVFIAFVPRDFEQCTIVVTRTSSRGVSRAALRI